MSYPYEKYSGFEHINQDLSGYPQLADGEISIHEFAALVGNARAITILNTVPHTLNGQRNIMALQSALPPSGTPLYRAIWDRAHELNRGEVTI